MSGEHVEAIVYAATIQQTRGTDFNVQKGLPSFCLDLLKFLEPQEQSLGGTIGTNIVTIWNIPPLAQQQQIVGMTID
jgi:hypothetical protein